MLVELNQRMTRTEVLSLVKHLLDGAKQDITNKNNALMVGHKAYRCLGCNRAHPQGVNRQLARKVNHNALPVSRGLLPSVFPYSRTDAMHSHSNPSISKHMRGTRRLSPLSTSYSQGRLPRKHLNISSSSRRRASSLDSRGIHRSRRSR